MPTENKIAVPEESAGVDFGIDGRSVRVSQEAYSIFLAREAAGREKIATLQQRLTAADERADVLEQALKFYAEREHYHFESGNWDTVSGEPLNILWNGDEPDFIEDGAVARAALKPAESHPCQVYLDGCDGSCKP
ncbi:hypothetical protein [Pseudomonas sp. Irchel 3E20]|uniref:hypothetical protein n=1 Tax=Pseudomonas sp. Irchel 3E20 TaxID=2008983 RepID=UPI000BA4D3C8|nr:hypothetical protein [Pseudomonas sp. Irchel 3E20]